MGPTEWFLLLALAFVWGGSFLFGRIVVAEIAPLTATWLRVALAALTLQVLVIAMREPGIALPWCDLAIMGLLNNVIPFSLILSGQTVIGAGLAAIVNAATPIWTVLLAHAATADERLSRRKVVGVLLGFTGVAVLVGTAALDGLRSSVLAQVAVLGATLSYALAGLWGRRFAKLPPVQTARGQLWSSTLVLTPLVLLSEPLPQAWPSAPVVASVVAMAVLSTALAYIMFFRILARAGATNVALVTFLVPPFAIVMGWAVLGETLELRHVVGFAIILAGLVAVDGRLLRRRMRERP